MHLYREFPPHPALAAHVACLWTSHAVPIGAPVTTRVLPGNCIYILWQDCAPLGKVAGIIERELLARLRTRTPERADLLARAAVARVGLPAKTFAMVCRFRRAHAALRGEPGAVDWARLAGDCGYCDQSHLIHAFRQCADATPRSFARSTP